MRVHNLESLGVAEGRQNSLSSSLSCFPLCVDFIFTNSLRFIALDLRIPKKDGSFSIQFSYSKYRVDLSTLPPVCQSPWPERRGTSACSATHTPGVEDNEVPYGPRHQDHREKGLQKKNKQTKETKNWRKGKRCEVNRSHIVYRSTKPEHPKWKFCSLLVCRGLHVYDLLLGSPCWSLLDSQPQPAQWHLPTPGFHRHS